MGRHDREAGSSNRRRRRSRSPPPAKVVPRRGTNFNLAEATILTEHEILVPVSWHLPTGWKVANDGHAIPPLPVDDADVEAVAVYRRSLMPPHQRNNPVYHDLRWWREQLRTERREAVERPAVPYGGPHNAGGRHAAWADLDVDEVLASLGYVPDTGRRRAAPGRVAFFGAPPRDVDASPLSPPAAAAVKEEVPVKEEDGWDGLEQAIADSEARCRTRFGYPRWRCSKKKSSWC